MPEFHVSKSFILVIAVACACMSVARAEVPYPNMPSIAPIGVKIGKYLDVPASAKGPSIDPAKGYRLQDLGQGLYMVTDNIYQSLLLTYDGGVVVIDAPPSYAARLPAAVAEVSDKPITHIIYSHSHSDHIGGAKALGGNPVIIDYIDRVTAQCVNTLTPEWSGRLAAFDVYIWDQCYAMEQSLRIE